MLASKISTEKIPKLSDGRENSELTFREDMTALVQAKLYAATIDQHSDLMTQQAEDNIRDKRNINIKRAFP